jgi:hypothetical protein
VTQSPPTEPWLHPALAVRSSPIDGQGLFAIEPLPEDTTVVIFGGRLVTDVELAALFAVSTAYIDTLSIDLDLNLVLPGRTPVGFGNHSCDPTLWWSGSFSLSTRRPLQVGDEATLDYGTITDAADFALDCACATTLCRGEVTGLDWQLPELQNRYNQHWVPALQKRIDRV